MHKEIYLAPFEKLLGMNIESLDNGKCVLSMAYKVELSQSAGLLHGGAIASLADTAVATAMKTLFPPSVRFGTVELKMSYLKPVKNGVITAYASVIKINDHTYNGIVDVTDKNGEAVAKAETLFKVSKKDLANLKKS